MTTMQIESRQREIRLRAKALNGDKFEGSLEKLSENEKNELKELMYRAMIISCICYNQNELIYNEATGKWGEMGNEYGLEQLGDERAMAIWKEQKEFMSKHAVIKKDTSRDMEGLRYNSIEWN